MASLHRVLPAPIEDSLRDKIQAMSCDIFRMLDCKGVARIDYMFDRASEQVYITEINTIPGSLAFYLWENKAANSNTISYIYLRHPLAHFYLRNSINQHKCKIHEGGKMLAIGGYQVAAGH